MARSRGLKKVVGLLLVVGVLGAAAAGFFDYVRERDVNPSTDDASIDADLVHVAPSVSGRVVSLNVAENDLVKAGDVLFQIDPEPYALRTAIAAANLKAGEALLATSRRNVQTRASNANVADEQVAQALTTLQLATNTLARVEPLLGKGYVSVQQVDDARTAKRKAEIAYAQALSASAGSKTAVGDTDAEAAAVEGERATLALAERDLRETVVRAPHDGRVTGLVTRSGEYVLVSQSLFTLVVTEKWFATANFRETELPGIATGACARVYSLIDRAVAIRGRVEGTGWGVIDQERLNLPRGVPFVEKSVNWVRVAQRFPVRVRLIDPPEKLMRLGASAVVEVRPGDPC